jgi:hypothetical protein
MDKPHYAPMLASLFHPDGLPEHQAPDERVIGEWIFLSHSMPALATPFVSHLVFKKTCTFPHISGPQGIRMDDEMDAQWPIGHDVF